MDDETRTTLAGIMAWMATGDQAAAVALHEQFGTAIRAAVRRAATRQGARLAADEVDALALELCLDLVPRAPSWDPGGALPWVWAGRLVGALVAREVGTYGVELDVDRLPDAAEPAAWRDRDGDALEQLQRLAAGGGRAVGLLAEALRLVASRRDAELVLRYRMQERQGDPSPSHTVARELGMRPPAVRKAVSRVRARLVALSRSDHRFADLADLPLLGPAAGVRAA
ncbi:MAG: hypothetical protein IPM45_05480 [Acidimicrobiales bacterium]|nr:hypothetical protein [Acidimicrobiales bacterium]